MTNNGWLHTHSTQYMIMSIVHTCWYGSSYVLLSWYSSPYLYMYLYLVLPRYSNQKTHYGPACGGEKRGDDIETGGKEMRRERGGGGRDAEIPKP